MVAREMECGGGEPGTCLTYVHAPPTPPPPPALATEIEKEKRKKKLPNTEHDHPPSSLCTPSLENKTKQNKNTPSPPNLDMKYWPFFFFVPIPMCLGGLFYFHSFFFFPPNPFYFTRPFFSFSLLLHGMQKILSQIWKKKPCIFIP